jgi:diacylglycerol kinase (ATP)
MINTALEVVVDLITEEYHPLAKTAKNVAAGSVLGDGAGSDDRGFFAFFDKVADRLEGIPASNSNPASLLVLIPIVAVLGVVMFLKILAGTITYREVCPAGMWQ